MKIVCMTQELAEKAKRQFLLTGYKAVTAGTAVITECPPNNVFAHIQCNVKAHTDKETDYDRSLLNA